MAWNPSPKVAAARDIGRKFDKHMVVVLMWNIEDNTLEYASYGQNKAMCDRAEELADMAFKQLIKEAP